jgi:K+-sensing histidine kinase KdpD
VEVLLDAAGNEERRRVFDTAAAAGQTATLAAALAQVVEAFIEQAPGAVTEAQCRRAIDALRQIGGYDALPVLARAYQSDHQEVRHAAALALQRICNALPGPPAQPFRLDGIFLECALYDMCSPLTIISGYCQLIIHTLGGLSQDDLADMVRQMQRECARLHEISRALRMATLAARGDAQHGEQLQPGPLVEMVSRALEGVRRPGARFAIDIPATLSVNCGSLLEDAILYFVDRVARHVPDEQATPVSARAWGREAVLTIGSDRPREPAQFPPPADGFWSAFSSGRGDVTIGAACMAVQACGGMVLVEAEESVMRTISICLPLGSAAQPQEETSVA